ncbi:phosphotransferase [Actinotalea sp.]|uniref:phosphotransferase family protein n=1 Tax=Actinotalea sp. TaxID=1872145 RepID=UPI002C4A14B9|nr:phosphotransferase [Actinotalea sp.]HQY32870.1 phosphotransferase [Actinotalea sp.]HRA50221.1 phosphotransferase [Actinotalea sp.]
MTSTSPRAFSGSRLAWSDLPRSVRRRIAELAGAEVVTEQVATNGFSPGFAAVLELGDGTEVFVKAVSADQNPESPNLARAEIQVAQVLPAGLAAPALTWSDDDGSWVLLGFEAVHGRSPEHPWHPDELDRVLHALTDLAEIGTPGPEELRPLAQDMAELATGWQHLAAPSGHDSPTALVRAVDAVGSHGPWLHDHLDELLAWSADAAAAGVGDTLVHGDLRADNVMIGEERVWLIDWPHATAEGARWWDLLAMLPSVAMQGGGDPDALFWSHPNARGADRDAVRAVLAGIAGYFVHGAVQAPPPGIANLRPFQLAQGVAALEWLRRF